MTDFGLVHLLASMSLLGAAWVPPAGTTGALEHDSRPILTTTANGEAGDRKWIKYGAIGAVACGLVGGTIGYFAATTTESVGYGSGPASETHRHTLEGALIGAAFGAAGGVIVGLREDRLTREADITPGDPPAK